MPLVKARDAMWFALATIVVFFLAPIALAYANSAGRTLEESRERLDPDEVAIAQSRVTRARLFAFVGVALLLALMLLFILSAAAH